MTRLTIVAATAAAALLALESAALASPGLIWIQGEGGLQAVNLRTFDSDPNQLTAGFVHTRATGPAAGLGLGLRFANLTLGGRLRGASFYDYSTETTVDHWQLWTFDGELGVRIPLF